MTSKFIKYLAAARDSIDPHFKGSTIEDLKKYRVTDSEVLRVLSHYMKMHRKLNAQSVSGRNHKKDVE